MNVQFEVRQRQNVTLVSDQGSTDVPMQPDITTSCTACCAAAAQEAAPTRSGEPTRGLDSRLVDMEFNSRFGGEPAYYANVKLWKH
jgi:hypothetical protein